MSSQGKPRYLSDLAELDWDFVGQDPDSGFARFHWHPARFLPQLPSIAIASLSNPGDRVLDPFCGSGTTLVEAALLGRDAVGIDTNPVATLITSAKVAPFDDREFQRYSKEILRSLDQTLGATGARVDGALSIPNLNEQEQWYHPRTLAELGVVWKAIEDGPSNYRLAAQVCFSATLKGVCSQDKHWGWICDNVRPKEFSYKDPVAAFSAKLNEYGMAAEDREMRRVGRSVSIVETGKCNEVLAHHQEASIDLVVTSPPYFGVTDYSKAQRLSYLWFGFALEENRQRETGARSKRHRKSALTEFLSDMEASFLEVARVMRKGGYCVIVSGESPSRDAHLGDFERIVKSCGFHVVERISRRLPTQRGLIATLKNESLLVCSRD